jgi:hypothetical protein
MKLLCYGCGAQAVYQCDSCLNFICEADTIILEGAFSCCHLCTEVISDHRKSLGKETKSAPLTQKSEDE